ncbi:MAG: histidine phosphatase family protein [bacterium]
MTVLYFVRHGETDLNRQQRCQGRLDYPLNDVGREQAAAAAAMLAEARVDRIYSSPLRRALEGAEMIARLKGLPVETRDWLAEIDHGELEGLNIEEADRRRPGLLRAWAERPESVDFPGGESLERVGDRAAAGLAEVLDADCGACVALCTHQVVAGAARCLLEDLPLSRVWSHKLKNGGIYRFAADDALAAVLAERLRAGRGAAAQPLIGRKRG